MAGWEGGHNVDQIESQKRFRSSTIPHNQANFVEKHAKAEFGVMLLLTGIVSRGCHWALWH